MEPRALSGPETEGLELCIRVHAGAQIHAPRLPREVTVSFCAFCPSSEMGRHEPPTTHPPQKPSSPPRKPPNRCPGVASLSWQSSWVEGASRVCREQQEPSLAARPSPTSQTLPCSWQLWPSPQHPPPLLSAGGRGRQQEAAGTRREVEPGPTGLAWWPRLLCLNLGFWFCGVKGSHWGARGTQSMWHQGSCDCFSVADSPPCRSW